ncbi:MAG: adenylate kinase [Bacteroidota bacterium]
MLNIIIFGAPGTGKGTQSENIINKYRLVHLSTGDIMREEIKAGSEIGKLAKQYIDDGLLVPDSVIFKNLYYRASRHTNPNGFIFDGFPRNITQAGTLDSVLNHKSIPISMVLYLDVTEEELFNRIKIRSAHSNRTDDNVEVIRKRIVVYNTQTLPLLDYYAEQGKLLRINGMGTVEEVFGAISSAIDNFISKNNISLN